MKVKRIIKELLLRLKEWYNSFNDYEKEAEELCDAMTEEVPEMVRDGRKVGNTTRMIDSFIQDLFEKGQKVYVHDHYDDPSNHIYILKRVRMRLELEHGIQINDLDIEKVNHGYLVSIKETCSVFKNTELAFIKAGNIVDYKYQPCYVKKESEDGFLLRFIKSGEIVHTDGFLSVTRRRITTDFLDLLLGRTKNDYCNEWGDNLITITSNIVRDDYTLEVSGKELANDVVFVDELQNLIDENFGDAVLPFSKLSECIKQLNR